MKSTGPRDTSLTRFNALKHGLTSKKIVVTPVENPTEYDTLVKALLQDFQPQTTTEKLLIQQVATCQWRRQRVIKAEKAQLESKVFGAPFEFHRNEQVRRDEFQSELGSICFNPNRPEEIDEILSNKELEEDGWLPQPKCYEAFVIQAIQNELCDLNEMIGRRLILPPTGKYFPSKPRIDR